MQGVHSSTCKLRRSPPHGLRREFFLSFKFLKTFLLKFSTYPLPQKKNLKCMHLFNKESSVVHYQVIKMIKQYNDLLFYWKVTNCKKGQSHSSFLSLWVLSIIFSQPSAKFFQSAPLRKHFWNGKHSKPPSKENLEKRHRNVQWITLFLWPDPPSWREADTLGQPSLEL